MSDTRARAAAIESFAWVAAAALSAGAAVMSIRYATPVDAALPFLACAVTLVAWAGRSSAQVAVPVMIVAELTVADETARMLLFGLALACVFASSLTRDPESDGVLLRHARACAIAVTAVAILRWLPFEDVRWGREALLVVLCVAIVLALRATPSAVAIAVLVVFITPAVPLRTVALPAAVLAAAVLMRAYGFRLPRMTIPSAAAVALPMLLFAWSGVAARGPLYFATRADALPQTEIHAALAPGQRIALEVPDGAASLVVSGANVAHLPTGTLLGTIQPGGLTVRIGDAADWGFMRREQFYASYNGLPRSPAGRIHGYGYSAWVDGAGRIAIPAGAKTIEVAADAAIPADASLQVEGFELRP